MTWTGPQTWGRVWPLATLCLLVASRWLLEGADPGFASTDWTEATGCVLVAVVLALTVWRQGRHHATHAGWRETGGRAVGTVLVLTGALISEVVAGRQLSAGNATLALALTPVVVAVVDAVAATEADADLPSRLWPGLAGVAGLLFLLPQPVLTDARLWAGLVSLPLLTGTGAVMLRAREREEPKRERGREGDPRVYGCLTAAALFAAFAWGRHDPFAANWKAGGACLDAGVAWLSLATLRRLGGASWTAQFLLIPLLGLGEGLIFLHPFLDVRSYLGLGLLMAGGVRQLFAGPRNAGSVPSLRVPPA